MRGKVLLAKISRTGGWRLRKGGAVHYSSHRENDILPIVQLIGHRSGPQSATRVHVPKYFARGRIEGYQILGIVGREEKVPSGGENTGLGAPAGGRCLQS